MPSRGFGRSLLCVALTLMSPATALAAGQPKLAILVVGLDPVAEDDVPPLEQVANATAAHVDRFERLSLSDLLDPTSAKLRARKVAEASEAMRLGQKAYDDLDTAQSLRQFDRAIKLYEQADLSESFNALTSAWTMKVASMVANGETRAAHAELDRLLPLAPKVVLSSNYFPPDSIAYAEKVRRSLANTQTSRLEVKSTGVVAQVFIDGKYAGSTPLRRNDLTQADHYVTVIAVGYVTQQHRVRSGLLEVDFKRAEFQPRLISAVERVRLDPHGVGRDKAAQDFGRAVGVDQVLLLAASKSVTGSRLETFGLRLDVKDGHNLAYRSVTLDQGESLSRSAELLCAALLTNDETRTDGPVSHTASAGGSAKPIAGYVLLGGGAALLAGWGFFGLSALSISNKIRTTPQTVNVDAERHTGKTYALLADVFLLSGLISAGTGGFLTLFNGGRSQPKGTIVGPDSDPEHKRASADNAF